ncbi:phosphomevalonate kinase [Serinibacter arcticus]|uniref:phosphomevalonate kinase n=1 Tax=Serinibacter arcticus TaxID=1655435 RepID=UPI0013050153|nr:phosphomevalonate kinase [Serinibacter arcticus]
MRPPPFAPNPAWDGVGTTALAPGKLFVAGEYGVVEAGQPAVLIAVDRRLSVTLRDADAPQELPGHGWSYLAATRDVLTELARERGLRERPFRVRTLSDLEDADLDGHGPRKYGLGSSAAVTAGAVVALESWYGLALTPDERLKAALLATWRVNARASGADVATALIGGWVDVGSPDRDAVGALLDGARGSVAAVLAQPWPGLHAAALPTPSFRVLVGWSGRPASTTSLVAAVRGQGGLPPWFVERSSACVAALRAAVVADDAAAASDAVAATRANLLELSAAVGVPLETPALATLVEVAREHGLVAKSSGAGGGDCGIALAPAGTDEAALHAAWERAGVQPLPVELGPGAAIAPR